MGAGVDGGRYRVGIFEFDARTLELWKDGRALRLRPQSARLLALLLSRPGELIDREEIREALWPRDTFVDFEQGVNHCVKQLRAALGDAPAAPRFIQTLPRRGYRFIAPVTAAVPHAPVVPAASPAATAVDAPAVDRPSPAGASWRRRAVAAVLIVVSLAATGWLWATRRHGAAPLTPAPPATAASPPTLAVRAFRTTGLEPTFGVGLASAVAARLGSRRVFTLPDAADGPQPEGADLVLDGAVTRTGDALVMVATVSNPHDGRVSWSDRIAVRASEIFSLEDVLAERVVGALALQLAAVQQERLKHRYTSDAAAYEDYLRGRAALSEYTPAGAGRAAEAFARAVAKDPNYALARAGLAMASADMYLRFAGAADLERWGERADAESRAALELDAGLAEAHLARAAVARKREFDWAGAIEASRRALVLNPGLDQAHFFIAAAYYHLGFMEEALLEMERGRSLHGLDLVEPLRIEALVALFSGSFTVARVRLEDVSQRSSQPIGDTYLALALYYSGDRQRGREMLEGLSRHPSVTTAARAGAALAGLLAADGNAAAARALAAKVASGRYRDHHVAYGLGVAYAQLGQFDDAARWLRTAADTGFPCVVWFERDPLLATFRHSPAFAGVIADVRVRRDTSMEALRDRR